MTRCVAKRGRGGLGRALLLSAGLLAASVARAAEDEQAPAVRLDMEEVQIRGEVERPEVFYIIPRREARLDPGPLSKDYREEILEPLLPGPFEKRARGR